MYHLLDRNTYSTIPFDTVFVPKSRHAFSMPIPFLDAFKQITNVHISVNEMDPDMSSNTFSSLEFNGNKYFKSNALKSGNQNALSCTTVGNQISLQEFIKNKVSSKDMISVSNTISVQKNCMQCNLYDKVYEDSTCLRQLANIASYIGLHLTSKNIYSEVVTNYTGRTIHILLDKDNIYLDPTLKTNTICTTNKNKDAAVKDRLTFSLKSKYYTYLSNTITSVLDCLDISIHQAQNYLLFTYKAVQLQYSQTNPCQIYVQLYKGCYPNRYLTYL
jgi:hypothetical protein